MRRISAVFILVALIAASFGAKVEAQDKAAYEQRATARYLAMFTWLDFDHDGTVTREEAEVSVEFTAVFDDIDINRDGVVTKEELHRFLRLRFGAGST